MIFEAAMGEPRVSGAHSQEHWRGGWLDGVVNALQEKCPRLGRRIRTLEMGLLMVLLLMSVGRRPLGISEKSELEKRPRISVKPFCHFVPGSLESMDKGESGGCSAEWVRMI